MNKEKEKLLYIMKNNPVRLAHKLGFSLLQDMHNEWIKDMVFGKEDKTLQSHRGSYKTTCVSISLTLLIILRPNLRIAFIRKTDTAVKEIILQVSKMLKSDFIKECVKIIWGVDLAVLKDNSTEITTNLTNDPRGTAQLTGFGLKGTITGQHYDLVFTDDIVTLEDRYSKAERETTKAKYQELVNIKNRGGREYNTGTPWHPDDAFLLMPNIERHDCYETGLISDAEMAELKAKMLPSLFAANYELKHIASEDVIFTNPQTDADPALAEQGIVHIDCAYDGEDLTAMTICNKKDGKYYVFGKCWRKNCVELEDEMMHYIGAFKAGLIYNEDNADKGFFAKDLRKKGCRVKLYHESMNKFVKITSYLKAEWQNVVFVKGTDKEYIDQICDFNENADHDDCPDSLSSVVRIYTKKKNEDYKPLWTM